MKEWEKLTIILNLLLEVNNAVAAGAGADADADAAVVVDADVGVAD